VVMSGSARWPSRKALMSACPLRLRITCRCAWHLLCPRSAGQRLLAVSPLGEAEGPRPVVLPLNAAPSSSLSLSSLSRSHICPSAFSSLLGVGSSLPFGSPPASTLPCFLPCPWALSRLFRLWTQALCGLSRPLRPSLGAFSGLSPLFRSHRPCPCWCGCSPELVHSVPGVGRGLRALRARPVCLNTP